MRSRSTRSSLTPARHRMAAFGLALALCATGCAASDHAPEASASPAYPLTVVNCGVTVVFEGAPRRTIAIKSTAIEMLLALDLEDRLVGVGFPDGPYSQRWMTESPPFVVSERVPAQEAVLAREPDLVFAGWESVFSAEGAGDRSLLAAMNVDTLVSPSACQDPSSQPNPLTWDHIWAEIALIGAVFDVSERADALIEQQRAELTASVPDDRALTAVWYSSGSSTPYLGGGIGSPQLIMQAAGLTNILDDVPMTWASASWESVIEADPDVIVLVDSAWGSTEKKIAQLEGNPATAALTAVRDHRYLVVPFAASEAGVRTVEAVQTLRAQLAELIIP